MKINAAYTERKRTTYLGVNFFWLNLRGEFKYKSGFFFAIVSYCFILLGKFKEVVERKILGHLMYSSRLYLKHSVRSCVIVHLL